MSMAGWEAFVATSKVQWLGLRAPSNAALRTDKPPYHFVACTTEISY